MTFDVQPAALKELAALLDRAKEDIDKSKQFLTQVEGFTGGGGILNSIGNGHREAYHALSDWLGKLSDPTLSGVAQGVRESAAYYERTDRASAEKLDASHPDVNSA